MSIFAEKKAEDFAAPTARPESRVQREAWQQANRAWWEAHPMRYDWKQPLESEAGERAWYAEMDRRFFAAGVIPQRARAFDGLIPFGELGALDVLEVGVGMGAHAQLLAPASRSYTGVDLTRAAVRATQRRFALCGVPGAILQMDAEKLAFPDASFDLVWSWGVIHHTSNTRAALEEIRRVLRPGGRALVMVYHRALVPWYVWGGLLRGVLLGGFARHHTIHGVMQAATDGALARYYSIGEWRREVQGLFEIERTIVLGNRAEALPLPAGKFKDAAQRLCPEAALRFWLTACRQGSMLYTELRRSRG
jgi:SAM-dependent methyltransferase